MYDFGFIGTGNMGSALLRALVKKVPAAGVAIYDADGKKTEALAAELGCRAAGIAETVSGSRYLVLGVKPQMLEAAAAEIKPCLGKDTVIVSMLAGTPVERIRSTFGTKVIRIMPSLACAVGEGIVLCCPDKDVTEEEFSYFRDSFSQSGLLDRIDEKYIDAAASISGCGPAFVAMMAEALADGAVSCGLPRDRAALYASQLMKGSGELLLKSGCRAAELKDRVCSPGGTTIEGVKALEEGGFRAAVIGAVTASYEKNSKL